METPSAVNDSVLADVNIIIYGRQLWSAAMGKMFITRSHTGQVQDSSFQLVASHIWNQLPTKVTDGENLE